MADTLTAAKMQSSQEENKLCEDYLYHSGSSGVAQSRPPRHRPGKHCPISESSHDLSAALIRAER